MIDTEKNKDGKAYLIKWMLSAISVFLNINNIDEDELIKTMNN